MFPIETKEASKGIGSTDKADRIIISNPARLIVGVIAKRSLAYEIELVCWHFRRCSAVEVHGAMFVANRKLGKLGLQVWFSVTSSGALLLCKSNRAPELLSLKKPVRFEIARLIGSTHHLVVRLHLGG
jgi:hypothetical protein